MPGRDGWVVVGLDNGGTSNNAHRPRRRRPVPRRPDGGDPSHVREGPDKSRSRPWSAPFDTCSGSTGVAQVSGARGRPGHPRAGQRRRRDLLRGATNFANPEWRGFDIRGALEDALGLPVIYNNDGNAAALYAHHAHFGAGVRPAQSRSRPSWVPASAAVWSRPGVSISGAAGMAGELGHVPIPMARTARGRPADAGVQLRPAAATRRAWPR